MSQSSSGILIRYGEVFLKRGRKMFFLDQLAGNLERALHRHDRSLKISRPYGRFLVTPKEAGARIEDAAGVAEAVSKVFGIVSAGPCEVIRAPTIESVSEATIAYAKAHRKRNQATFKISTRRADKDFPLGSIECNQRIGSDVWTALGNIEVDVHNPDLEIGVEIRKDHAFIYGASVPGAGGLPVGSNGKALLLLSGGIDSPVAGWLTQKRGVAVDAVTFLSPPYTGPQVREKTITLARKLAATQKKLKLWLVPFAPLQEHYRDTAPHDQLVLLYRRSMIRISDRIAAENRHQALVTGESIGQVASQTLANLHCIGSVSSRPVIRPLVTYDKGETITVAKRIGTFETSILPFDDCCSLFVPKHPELRGNPKFLAGVEGRVEPGALEEQLLSEAELMEFPD